MYVKTFAALGLVGAVLAGCGDDPAERALTGGAIGAAGGAAAGEVLTGDAGTGALVGGAAGAAAGGLTDREDIDLGDNPLW